MSKSTTTYNKTAIVRLQVIAIPAFTANKQIPAETRKYSVPHIPSSGHTSTDIVSLLESRRCM